ncbi:MAG: polyprenyl synthetase family protein [Anaerolineales bacterium]|nr:polyprenyl synthetase family protein [Anaerolineales bacterium]
MTQTADLLERMREAVENDLIASIHIFREELPAELLEMLEYHLGWRDGDDGSQGKRIRPLLNVLCCGAVGGDWHLSLPAASSLELIHNFSLIHDDIEDQSETRRGRQTVWKRWGIARAVNAGDSLFVIARLTASRLWNRGVAPELVSSTLDILDQACLKLTIGQELDLSFEELESVSIDAYLDMIKGKTASLISAATLCGGIIAAVTDEICNKLRDYGHHLGMAFQIQDDILGIWGSPSKTGKSSGDDLRARKKTLPILFGLIHSAEFKELWLSDEADDETLDAQKISLERSGAKEFARNAVERHTQSAQAALGALQMQEPYGEALTRLTSQLLHRQS